MSTIERWAELRELLNEALDADEAGRAALLVRVREQDSALAAELETLLLAHGDAGAVDRMHDLVRRVMDADAERRLGQLVGTYRLVRIIESGGMGAVYLGEREGDFDQRVAVKLIRVGLSSPEVVERFLAERQIMARLEHPNIARLLDGGLTDRGEPYFAMEYVEGVPLRQYCDARNLTVQKRLELFAQVCAAVQYAHQNLIVHRDLKPANILVTAAGQVKLLDFGIAKLLEAETNRPGPGARTTMRWLTPDYAAPEQVRGEPITTAADIYALGLILYELLAGQRAYQFDGASPAEIERIITEQEPERPSAVATSPAIRRQLTGDLDTIVLKALHKEPTRRYVSAEQLAEDIERFCAGLPVRARADTLRYRASKFVRRHRVMCSTIGVVLAVLVGALAVTSWLAQEYIEQTHLARDERVRARDEASRAEQVSEFVVDIFRITDSPNRLGDTASVRVLLEKRRADVARELSDQPALQAGVLDALGRIYRNLGRYDQALEVWQEALTLRRQALGPDHPDVARNLTDLARLHHRFSRFDLAEPLLRQALDVWNKQLREPSADMATALSSLGDIVMMKRDYLRAEQFYRQALDVRRKALGPEHPDVAFDLANVAALMMHSNPTAADSLFSEALAVQRKRLAPDDAEMLNTLDGLAGARFLLGRLDEAAALHREALDVRRRILIPDHPETTFTLENLARVEEKRGDPAAAEAHYREALAAKTRHFGPRQVPLTRPLMGLGRMLHSQGRCAQANPVLREALDIWVKNGPADGPAIKELRTLLASCRPRASARSE